MDNRTLSELIGLIYDAAFDLDLWPRLLEFLSDELESLLAEEETHFAKSTTNHINYINTIGRQASADNGAEVGQLTTNEHTENSDTISGLLDILHPHFTRALSLNRRIFESQQERNIVEELLERLPLGMMVVNGESRVLAYNRKLDKLISTEKELYLMDGVLSAKSSTDTVMLRRLVRAVASGEEPDGAALSLSRGDTSSPISALIIPLKGDASERVDDNRVALLFAAPEILLEIPQETLMSLYHLTAAEARLVSSLVRDADLNSIADDFGVSKHTLRTQLKSVYDKTGTHRQAELVRQVITGPAMLANVSLKKHDSSRSSGTYRKTPAILQSNSRRDQILHLSDGRRLGFAEYGMKDGQPTIFMHSSLGSRIHRYTDERTLKKFGIRLIVPDRPGVGLSDSRRNMTILDWADDVERLADHLGLDRFNIIGYSAGGPFALACAHKLRQRTNRIVLASTMAPFTSIWDLHDISASHRLLLSLSKYAPSLLRPILPLINLPRRIDSFYNELLKQMSPLDQAFLREPQIRSWIIEEMNENLRQGDRHILRELLLITHDWGFELSEVQVPVELWHGESDRAVPFTLVKRLEKMLPDCRAHYLPGAGHYLFFYCWEEIIKAAVTTNPRTKKKRQKRRLHTSIE